SGRRWLEPTRISHLNVKLRTNGWKPGVEAAGLLKAPDPRSPPHRRSQSHRRRSPFRGDRQFIGHSSIMVIVDIYGHLFPSGHEAQADARILAISDGPETDKPGQT